MNYATCSFFDILRREDSGKRQRIGIYSSELHAPQLPINYAEFWVSVKYGTPVDAPDPIDRIEIHIPGETKPVSVELGQKHILPSRPKNDDSQFYLADIDIPIRPFVVKEEGDVKVRVVTQSGDVVPAGRLKIINSLLAEESQWSIPLNLLNSAVAYFQVLSQRGSKKDLREFSEIALKRLSDFMPHDLAKMVIGETGSRVAIDNRNVFVMFDTPMEKAPEIVLILPDDQIEATVDRVTRFGFEVLYSEPPLSPLNFEYTAAPRSQ